MWDFNQDPLDAYHQAVRESKNRIRQEKLQKLQRRLTEKRRVARLPNCPNCDAKCEYGIEKCESCEQELIWAEYLIGRPGDEVKLHQQLAEDEQKYHKRRNKRRQIRKGARKREARSQKQQLIAFAVLLAIAVIGLIILWPKIKIYLPDISFD